MFEYQPQLTGTLLALRPVTAADRDALYAVAADPLVWELHPDSDRWQAPVFQAYFDEGLASGGAVVAIDRATGAVAGWSRYAAAFAGPGEIEIGWTFLGRAYWGGAYNRELKNLMLAHAFRFVERVIFRIGEHNLRSRRAVEKLGATLTGQTEETTARGLPSTNVFYAISAARTTESRSPGRPVR